MPVLVSVCSVLCRTNMRGAAGTVHAGWLLTGASHPLHLRLPHVHPRTSTTHKNDLQEFLEKPHLHVEDQAAYDSAHASTTVMVSRCRAGRAGQGRPLRFGILYPRLA